METRDQLQRALQAAQEAKRAKSRFMRVVIHELRTPLNSILGFSDLMLDDHSESEQRTYLSCVQQGGSFSVSSTICFTGRAWRRAPV